MSEIALAKNRYSEKNEQKEYADAGKWINHIRAVK